MKHLLLTLAIIVTCSKVSLAQKSLSDYSFVVVPDEFEFLSKANQYQLNDMTKYYLTKNGFNTYYFSELPSVDNCDGLWADVESIVGFTRTKIVVVLKDCKGNEVFRGENGTSKQKDYKTSFQDALRNAFLCFKTLDVKQKAVTVHSKDTAAQPQDVVIAPKASIGRSSRGMGPENQFNAYTYKSVAYLLKKIAGGYNLYDASTADLILKGTITYSKTGYTGVVFGLDYQCSFLENQDLLLVGQDQVSLTLVFQN